MATPQEIREYYEGYPDPDASETWGFKESGQPRTFAEAQNDWVAQHGEAPEPAPVPGPPTVGSGMPAARAGDLTAHGGTVGPVTTGVAAQVNIGYRPAACMGDPHICPMFTGTKPHAGGTITKGSATVFIGGKPAARVSDLTVCTSEPGQVAGGEFTVFIGDLGAAGGAGSEDGWADSAQHGAGDDHSTSVAATENECHYADMARIEQPPGESVRIAGTGTHWIEIELVDEAEQPVPGEQYLVRFPDGKEMTGGLDTRGRVRITGIKKPGWCQIKFPNLDLAAWERWRPASGRQTPVAPTGSISTGAQPSGAARNGRSGAAATECKSVDVYARRPGPVTAGPATRAGSWHRVLQGECVSSIAKDTGHFWHTIWNHPVNAELKRRREDANVLLPGDAVFVPAKRPKEEPGSTDQHHKFRRKGEPAWLRVAFKVEDVPRAGEPYVVEIDGDRHSGVLDAHGALQCPIPGYARRGRIVVGTEPQHQSTYEFALGQLDPVTEVSGVQARLNHLGFDAGRTNHCIGPSTRAALERFQTKHGLAVTGEADESTCRLLEELHGS